MLTNSAYMAFHFGSEAVRWLRYGGRCPCFNPATGQHDVRHELCRGAGTIYIEQFPPQPCADGWKALITNYSARRHGTIHGELTDGDLVCSTWHSKMPLAERDIIIVPSRAVVVTETLCRSDKPWDDLREYEPNDIIQLTSMRGEETIGFRLDGRKLMWDEDRVLEGERYTIVYTHHPHWMVAEGSIVYRKPDPLTGVELPQRVGLKLVNPSMLDMGGTE